MLSIESIIIYLFSFSTESSSGSRILRLSAMTIVLVLVLVFESIRTRFPDLILFCLFSVILTLRNFQPMCKSIDILNVKSNKP